MSENQHKIIERGDVIYVIGPREGHTWFGREGMWEVCRIDNAVMWDSAADEAIDRDNARKIRDGLNSYASSQAEIERLRTALKDIANVDGDVHDARFRFFAVATASRALSGSKE